jgi:hypothetical protein
VSDFRGDGEAALDWVAGYLERVGELPVASSVSPGEVRAKLAPSPPEHGEPFEAVLRDLDEAILPGITHWNHPRFFGYFANTGSEPGILAELIVAALNVNAMLWTTSPAATEVEELALDWLAQLLGLPQGLHGHIDDTASTATIIALAARPRAASWRSRAHLRARELLCRKGRAAPRARVPLRPRGRRVPDACQRARRTDRGRRRRRSDGGHNVHDLGRPRARDRAAV